MNFPYGNGYSPYNTGDASGTQKRFADGLNDHAYQPSRGFDDFGNGASDYTGSSAGTPDRFDTGSNYHTGSHSGRPTISAHDYTGSPSLRHQHFPNGLNNHVGSSLETASNLADSTNDQTTNYAMHNYIPMTLIHDQRSLSYLHIDSTYPNPQTIDPARLVPMANTIHPPALQRERAKQLAPISIPSTSHPLSKRRGPRSPQVSPTARSPPVSPTRIKKYGCRICQKMFDRLTRANECEIKHSDDKPYPCNGKCGDPNWYVELYCHLQLQTDQYSA